LASPGLWKPRAISALIPSWAAGRPRDETYVGKWTDGALERVKVPGTHKRRPRKRHAADVHRDEQPELRIVDQAQLEFPDQQELESLFGR
jgi:hypothetical protein